MQSNTAEIRNQPVGFSSFSVEKKRRESDPFTISDGRYFGSDGFVVPKDFPEFFRRFPDYVQRWVSKHAPTSASEEDKEDWTQDLLIHLSRLTPTSKYREVGKKDVVQTFDPLRHYGANEARFRNYINLCLANKFRTMHSKRVKDALCRPGNLSLGGENADEDSCSVDDLCHKHSAHLRAVQKACQKQSDDRAFLQEFLNFVRRADAKALPIIEALMTTGTRGEAVYWLRVTFHEAIFWLEQWRFRFLLRLASARRDRDVEKIRSVLLGALDELRDRYWRMVSTAVQSERPANQIRLPGQWQGLIRELHAAFGAPPARDPVDHKVEKEKSHRIATMAAKLRTTTDPVEQERLTEQFRIAQESGEPRDQAAAYARELLNTLRPHLSNLATDKLKMAVTTYLGRCINEVIGPLRPLLDLTSEEGPKLYLHSENLKQRFYWMFSFDLAGGRLPRICEVCGDLFFASKRDSAYGAKTECREMGRKRLHWHKHKDKYNRNRRRKYKGRRIRK